MKKIFTYCASRNVYADMARSIKSLLENTDVDEVHCFIEDDVFKFYYPTNKIIIHNVSNLINNLFTNKNCDMRFSKFALFKVYLSTLFKTERIVYIDTDTYITGSLNELWTIDLTNYDFAAVLDRSSPQFNHPYYNAGLIIFNINEMLSDNIPNRAIKLLNACTYQYPDQDVLNLLCHNKIYTLDAKYNSSVCTKLVDDAALHHFAGYSDKRKSPNYNIVYKNLRRI